MRRLATRRFDFADSRLSRRFVLAAHGATLALVGILPVNGLMGASLALLVVASGLRAWRALDRSLAGMVLRSDATLTALQRDGRAVDGTLAPGSVARPGHAAIAWRATGERRLRVESVPSDRVGPAAHRELRAMLRYATSGDVAARPASQARASISAALSALGWPARRCR